MEHQLFSWINGTDTSTESIDLQAHNAWDVLVQWKRTLPISTLCKCLDELLQGGIRSQQLVEVCGAPGTGKTQLMYGAFSNTCHSNDLCWIGCSWHAMYIFQNNWEEEKEAAYTLVCYFISECISNL